jgi:hypothetical protein
MGIILGFLLYMALQYSSIVFTLKSHQITLITQLPIWTIALTGALLAFLLHMNFATAAHTSPERVLHVGLRLRGGGAQQSTMAPKYQSNRALKPDEFTPPFGTLIRSRSGALFSPTPTPHW